MKDLRFYIQGKKVNPFLEYRAMELELNFENLDETQTTLTPNKVTFVREEANMLNALKDGLQHIYSAPSYRIEYGNKVLFNGYIDMKNARFSCEKVEADIYENLSIDWMEKVGDSFSFDLLYANGVITDNDFIRVPYILSEIPDYQKAALYFLYAFVIAQEIAKLVKNIADVVADLAGVFSTIAGVIKAVILLAYTATLIVAIIKLIKDELIPSMIVPIKYHKAMYVVDLFSKACQHLGLTFSSSIFQTTKPTLSELTSGDFKNAVIIPEKRDEGFLKNASGGQTGYYEGTFGDFIRDMSTTFNAKFVIIGNTFHFERVDYGSSARVYKIPDVRRDFVGLNASELPANYLVQFQIDNLDLNTIVRYRGTSAQNYVELKDKLPDTVSALEGLQFPNIPFALGRRKNELTRIESLIEGLLSTVDKLLAPMYKAIDAMTKGIAKVVKAINKIIKVINTFGGNIKLLKEPQIKKDRKKLSTLITNRIGMLALSSDFIGVKKLVLVTGSGWDIKISTNNEDKMSAQYLWEKFHYIQSPVPSVNKPFGAQRFIYDVPVIPFCMEDYELIRGDENDNQGETNVVSPSGVDAKILSLKWNIWNDTAAIKYSEEGLFETNIKEKLLINAGD